MLSIRHINNFFYKTCLRILRIIETLLISICILVIPIIIIVIIDTQQLPQKNVKLQETHILTFIDECLNECKLPPKAIVEFQIADQTFYGWIGGDIFSQRLFGSAFGPAVYVFNQEGILVDLTGDIQDHPTFKSTWMPLWESYRANENFLSVEDIQNRFAVLPVHSSE